MSERWVDFDEHLKVYRLCERINERHIRTLAQSPTRKLMEFLLLVTTDFNSIDDYKNFMSNHAC